MKILVRLPNWLGDMVMSIPFLEHISQLYPAASVSVIVKKGLEPLLDYFPPAEERFVFSKEAYPGIKGVYNFRKKNSKGKEFDFFFCLPDSLSSAVMGWACGAKNRIGFANEARSLLLTKSFKKNTGQHRVLQYVSLLEHFYNKKIETTGVRFTNLPTAAKEKKILINIHSEAVSRRLPKEKAVSVITRIRESTVLPIILTGGPGDIAYTEEVMSSLPRTDNIISLAGRVGLKELPLLMNSSSVMLSTDSGPAHVANAAGLPTVILFGAGNEKSTAPFNKQISNVIRLGQLPCEPCVKNTCQFGLPKCLEQLDDNKIASAVLNLVK